MKDESEASTATDIMTHNGNLSPDSLTKRQEGLFSFFLAPAMQVKPWSTFSIRKAYEYITTDMDALTATYRLRDIHDEKERKLFKKRGFAFCTFSGIFRYRSRDGLISHSGLLCIDIDHVGSHFQLDDLRKRLIDDEQFLTELCFVTEMGGEHQHRAVSPRTVVRRHTPVSARQVWHRCRQGMPRRVARLLPATRPGMLCEKIGITPIIISPLSFSNLS